MLKIQYSTESNDRNQEHDTRLFPGNTRNTNISFPPHRANFAVMSEQFQHLIRVISKGDTRLVESFFRRPGGRKYLENITLILIHTLAPHYGEKEEMYQGFVEVLDRMEDRIRRKNEGEEILEGVLGNS